jgi:hypothetical protein
MARPGAYVHKKIHKPTLGWRGIGEFLVRPVSDRSIKKCQTMQTYYNESRGMDMAVEVIDFSVAEIFFAIARRGLQPAVVLEEIDRT